ncbi:MAG: hypothetical protein WC997_06490 [Porticoccaceae bacterium]
MAEGATSRLAGSVLFLLYPLAVFTGLRYLDPRWLAALLMAVAACRLLVARPGTEPMYMVLAAAGACIITLVFDSSHGLLLYPVMVNGLLLLIFAASLARPPSAIEVLARVREPDLPPEAIRYTRRVTQVWAVFFAFNGAVALATVFLDPHWWALYNGLIAYLLMAILMGGEWLVRRRVRVPAHG